MLYSTTSRHPLDITMSITSGSSQRISMINKSLQYNGDCLKSTMGVYRKSRNVFPVVHPPPITQYKIVPDAPTFK